MRLSDYMLIVSLAAPHALGQDSFPIEPENAAGFRQGVAGQTVAQSVVLTQDIRSNGQTALVLEADDIVLDCAGHTIIGNGSGHGVESIDHSGVTITNCVIENFDKGIYLASTDGKEEELLSFDNVVRDNTLTANQHGVFLMWSHRATIAGNRLVGNTDSAISLTGNTRMAMRCSNDVTVSGNEFQFNRRGLVVFCPYKPASGVLVKDNVFSYNVVSVTDRFEGFDRIRYSYNTFDENMTTVFSRYSGDHQLLAGVPKEFDIGMYRSNGEECSDFEIESVTTTPHEPLTVSREGNRIQGRFVPHRKGMYSLLVSVRGCDQKLVRERYWLGTEKSMTYYLHPGRRNDVGMLYDEPPSEPVRVYCTMWIEAGIELTPPESGIAKISGFRSSMWSNYIPFSERSPYQNLWGVEFDHTYSRRGDVWVSIDGEHEKGRAQVVKEIIKGPFIYDRSDWLDLAIKYWGREPDWTSGPDAPSSVEVSYVVSDAPHLESLSNRDVRVLSATSSPETPEKAEIVLDGKGLTSLSLRMSGTAKKYRIDIDGNACGPGSGCRHAQDGARLTVDVDLSGEQRAIVITGE